MRAPIGGIEIGKQNQAAPEARLQVPNPMALALTENRPLVPSHTKRLRSAVPLLLGLGVAGPTAGESRVPAPRLVVGEASDQSE